MGDFWSVKIFLPAGKNFPTWNAEYDDNSANMINYVNGTHSSKSSKIK